MKKNFFKVGDKIEKGDILFSYKLSDERIRYFKSNLSGKIKNISSAKKFHENSKYLYLENLNNLKEFDYKFVNGCNIHPHQIYTVISRGRNNWFYIYILYISKISFT